MREPVEHGGSSLPRVDREILLTGAVGAVLAALVVAGVAVVIYLRALPLD